MDYFYWIIEYIFVLLKMNDVSVGFEGMVKDENYVYLYVCGRKCWYILCLKKNYYKVLVVVGVNVSVSDMVIWLNV